MTPTGEGEVDQDTLVIIPARMGGRRFPGKALAEVRGKPLLRWTWEGVRRWARAAATWIATNSDDIAKVAEGFGAKVVKTSPDCRNGTVRTWEAFKQWTSPAVRYVANVQADEPCITPAHLDSLVPWNCNFGIATLAAPFASCRQLLDPNAVKVIRARTGRALYFTRTPLPNASRHIGIYAFDAAVLNRVASLPPSDLSQAESLEQLDWLDAGMGIDVRLCEHHTVSVNTPEDIPAFEAWLDARK